MHDEGMKSSYHSIMTREQHLLQDQHGEIHHTLNGNSCPHLRDLKVRFAKRSLLSYRALLAMMSE